MPRNYRQARKQRELPKKERLQRRTARLGPAAPAPDIAASEGDSVATPDATGRAAS